MFEQTAIISPLICIIRMNAFILSPRLTHKLTCYFNIAIQTVSRTIYRSSQFAILSVLRSFSRKSQSVSVLNKQQKSAIVDNRGTPHRSKKYTPDLRHGSVSSTAPLCCTHVHLELFFYQSNVCCTHYLFLPFTHCSSSSSTLLPWNGIPISVDTDAATYLPTVGFYVRSFIHSFKVRCRCGTATTLYSSLRGHKAPCSPGSLLPDLLWLLSMVVAVFANTVMSASIHLPERLGFLHNKLPAMTVDV